MKKLKQFFLFVFLVPVFLVLYLAIFIVAVCVKLKGDINEVIK